MPARHVPFTPISGLFQNDIGCGLARIVRDLAGPRQRHVRVAAEGQPLDLAGRLVAAGKGERSSPPSA